MPSLLPFIRYISLDDTTFYIVLIIYFFKMISLNLVYASVPMVSRELQILFCFIRLFVSPFGLSFLKLSFSFLRFKELLNSGQQRSCKRVDLIVRYPRIVFLSSGHSADKFPPFAVFLSGYLFSCYPVSIFTSRFIFFPPLPLRSRFPTCLFSKMRLVAFFLSCCCW